MIRIVLGAFGAVIVHVAILLFGGILFMHDDEGASSKRDVELLSTEPEKDKPEEKPEQTPEQEPLKSENEPPPDPNDVIKSVDVAAVSDDAPALDAASLSALEQALNGNAGGGGDFGGGASLAGGGRIGGTGRGGGESEHLDSAFSMSEIDQKPRAVHQVAATYPAELRSKKIEGVVAVIFIVDESGRVANPRVEKSSHTEFEKPALDALRQWKFEPALKSGKPVSCRMRVPFRFQTR